MSRIGAAGAAEKRGEWDMTRSEYRPSVPEDWFVDPVRLGMPGVRSSASHSVVEDDEN